MEEHIIKAFGERIRLIRFAKKWTQQQLSEKAGLHVNCIGRIERGIYDPSLTTLIKLCKALEMHPSYIVEPYI